MNLALVTGGAGFIGSHLVRALLERGWRVRVMDNLSSGHRHNLTEIAAQLELMEADIRDASACQRAAAGAKVVFHLAAQGSVPRSVELPAQANDINVNGTLNMLIAARDAGAERFVFSASSAAYGETEQLPKVETMAPQPLSPYAVSKLAGEFYCACFARTYGLQCVSLRYFNVFGPRQDPKSQYAAAIPALVSRMLRGEPPIIFGDGEQTRDFCFVENVVEANLLSATTPRRLMGEVVNIACGERTSLNEIIRVINQQLGTQIAPQYQAPRAGDVKHSLAALEAAREVLGYTPRVMFAEGLARSIAWYRTSLV